MDMSTLLVMFGPGIAIFALFAVRILIMEYKQAQKRKRWAEEDRVFWENFDREQERHKALLRDLGVADVN